MRRVYSILAIVLLPGCLLDQEVCGPEFVEDESGRCVLAATPPPFRETQPDAAVNDDDGFVTGPDAAPIPDAAGPPHPWADRNFIVVVDRTPPSIVRRTPRTPGVDVDAIAHGPANRLQFATRVAESLLIDGPNAFDDPGQVLGPPFDRNDPNLAVSLGGEGGFVAVPVELGRPLTWGDQIVVHVQAFDGSDDTYELFLCRSIPIRSRDCISAGAVASDVIVATFEINR